MTAPVTGSKAAGLLSLNQRVVIAKKLGYTGREDERSVEAFYATLPGARDLVAKLGKKAQEMKSLNAGGVIRKNFAHGGATGSRGSGSDRVYTEAGHIVTKEEYDQARSDYVNNPEFIAREKAIADMKADTSYTGLDFERYLPGGVSDPAALMAQATEARGGEAQAQVPRTEAQEQAARAVAQVNQQGVTPTQREQIEALQGTQTRQMVAPEQQVQNPLRAEAQVNQQFDYGVTSTARTEDDRRSIPQDTFTPVADQGQRLVQQGTRALTSNKDVPSTSTATNIADISAERVTTPELPEGTAVDAVGVDLAPGQFIDTNAGNVAGDITTGVERAVANTATAAPITDANLIAPEDIAKVSGEKLDSTLAKNVAATGEVDPRAEIVGQTDNTTDVSKLKSASTEGILMDDPNKRVLTEEEKVKATASAKDAAIFTEKIQAATATPTEKATVKGQLAVLMQDFEGGETPPWASGAMRSVATTMAARGLSVSSIAGQALVQAAMESALPIASADASTFAKFESQNLSNRQERAMLAAEQRAIFMGQEFDQTFQAKVMNAAKVSDIANLNFTAEQQVALENSRIANTVNLANLSNKQALIMAEAAALSQLETVSLNNRQQAEVKNSENLMAMDFANLSNEQAMNVFNAQTRTQALFSDVAAENAAEQFNATSQNQTDQFFASLTTQNSQFNVAQTNAINQFNAGETNAQSRFTSEMMNQREQFNANNKMAIEQSNVVWRRTVATADTESINRVNELNASAALGISNTAYNNMWQYFADTMENAYTATNSERDRMTKLAVAKLQVDAEFDIAKWQADAASSAAMGNAIVKIATTSFTGDTIFEKGWDWLTKSK